MSETNKVFEKISKQSKEYAWDKIDVVSDNIYRRLKIVHYLNKSFGGKPLKKVQAGYAKRRLKKYGTKTTDVLNASGNFRRFLNNKNSVVVKNKQEMWVKIKVDLKNTSGHYYMSFHQLSKKHKRQFFPTIKDVKRML